MKSYRVLSVACLLVTVLLQPFSAQSQPAPPVRGPFWSGTVRGPKTDQAIAMKGITVTVGANKTAYVCYDTDLMRLSLAWTGEFLEFGNTLTKIEWPPPPQVKGSPVFGVKSGPGWAKNGSFEDPRTNKQGPMPKDWVHYLGLYEHGDEVVFKYAVNGVPVLELPGYEGTNAAPVFTRTLQFLKESDGQSLVLADGVEGSVANDFAGNAAPVAVKLSGDKTLGVAGFAIPAGSRLETVGSQLVLKLGHASANKPFRLALSSNADAATFASVKAPADLRPLTKGGPAHWTEDTVTKGVRGTGNDAYVVDTLTEPTNNPYHLKTFFGGFDFFADGRAAICTFHGDVWIVSGIDDSLEKLTWKRYASGLFQPLGVRIVKDTVYVLGRDQITRLSDLNNDGEADFYENFNNDTVVTSNYHEFCLDLDTDREGNFYFAKGAPWPPDVTSPHQGCMFKVSKDGSKMEIIATGLRAPNGMAIGPHDEITVSDNQGHWMPSSKLDWIDKGGFYGMVPSAQRTLTLQRDGTTFEANPSDPQQRAKFNFKAWGDPNVPIPVNYDKPLCWLPMSMDNSSGGQVWSTSDKWGPFKNRLFFMSYGKCTFFEVMPEVVEGTRQAAMVQFPFKLNSGVMRGRTNPHDGQVYVAGLKGWQTSATRDGGFYRIRYTGQPVRMPAEFHVAKNGVTITFTCAVDPKSATDTANYSSELWNYIYTGAYGSPEVSASDASVKKHDHLEVKGARVLPDGKSVFLTIDGLKPADQLKIKFNIDAADGGTLSQEIYGTIYKLGSAQ